MDETHSPPSKSPRVAHRGHSLPIYQPIMRSLCKKSSLLLSFLENDSLKYGESNLEPRIRDVAYEEEAIIESRLSYLSRPKTKIHYFWGIVGLLLNVIPGFHQGEPSDENLEFQHDNLEEIVKKLDSILEEVVKMKERNQVKDLPQTKSMPSTSLESGRIDRTSIVGLRKQMMEIKDRLTASPSRREIVSIVGMSGIGKTTLARTLYDDPVIVRRFDVRAWITVSHDYHVQQMLTGLLDSIQNIDHGSYPDDLADHLHKTLKRRRYLIVMDDVWNTTVWEQVRRFFPDDNNGSRIILTTRLKDVAIDVECPDSIYHLSLLSSDDSWKLLCQKVFGVECCPTKFEDIGREIAKNCKGLPLALAVIGGILHKADRTLDYWRYVEQNVNSALTNTDDQVMEILSLSYKHLPHHLRACFLYMGVFPEDHEISKSKLIRLWIAEGFIKPTPSKCLEKVACESLENLIDRNMIVVRERNYVGGIKKCGIHDLMRDICMRIAQDEKFLKVVYSQLEIPLDYGYDFRRLYIHSVSPDCLAGIYGFPANSLLFSQTESTSTDMSSRVLSSYQLRVLDAQESPFSNFQDEIGELVGLRYISFPCMEEIYALPSSISKLLNLQTLAMTSRNAVILPFEIWLMPWLQHIKTRKCFLPYPKSWEKIVPLKNLQTLKGVTNFRFTEDAIQMMPNLKKLGIIFKFDRSADLSFYCIGNLVHLHQLESLNVSIKGESDTKYPLPENLSLPPTLRKLTLSYLKLSQEHMAMIGDLQDLKELNLKRISFDDSQWEAIEGEFLGLKSLFINNTDLKYLKADETSFPILESLRFSFCAKLIQIPPEIGDIPTLQLIKLHECSQSAEDSALLIQKEQEDLGNYNLRIAISSRQMLRIAVRFPYTPSPSTAAALLVNQLITRLTLLIKFTPVYTADTRFACSIRIYSGTRALKD